MKRLLAELSSADVIVCCGPGGVGKTTMSASIAISGALSGRRVCVLTVDPAKRLADALGIETLGNQPSRVPGIEGGSLDALMLDTAKTFDDLISRYASSSEQVEAISANRLYRSLANALSGTQEYMAMEKLYELTTSGDYDLVVVDTPPSRNALDLLDAPRRLTSFLENRIFRALLVPTRAYLRAVSFATRALLSTIGSVAGAELVNDAVTFFQAFAGMEEGFAQRAGAIHDRLRVDSTAFVLVTSPRPDAIAEAQFFADKLAEVNLRAAGVIVNRVHPRFTHATIPAQAHAGGDLGELVENLERLDTIAANEELALSGLVAAVAPAPVATVPLSNDDIHDLAGLSRLVIGDAK
jgi:anion-transporting  ArsA/GET3 family ATPase